MPNTQFSDFYLGANTPAGFRSFFHSVYTPADGWQVFIIKGGPGTGKSTLMKQVCSLAGEEGHAVQRIHCSSDPDSLDGVILPGLRRAIFDGTAPHVMEPALPGACEQLVNLGEAWDSGELYRRREEISLLSGECARLHRQATRMLACAHLFRLRLTAPEEQTDTVRLDRTAKGLCRRLGLRAKKGVVGTSQLRLTCAVTPKGILNIADDYMASFGCIVPVSDRFYLSGQLLERIRELLLSMGYNVICCPCSQDSARLEHLLLPAEDICFTTRSFAHGEALPVPDGVRSLRTDRFLPRELTAGRHPRRTADRRELLRFTQMAADAMAQAKTVHDRLESCYRPAMDFDAVNKIALRVAERMVDTAAP